MTSQPIVNNPHSAVKCGECGQVGHDWTAHGSPTPPSDAGPRERETGDELDDETFLTLWEIRARTIGEHGTTPILGPALRRLLSLANSERQHAVCDICDAEMTPGGVCPKCSFTAAAHAAEGPRDEPVGARDLPSAADSLFLIASKALHRQTPKYLTLRAAALAVVEDNRSRCEVLRMEPSPLMRALAAALVDEELTDALDDLAAANAEVSDAK